MPTYLVTTSNDAATYTVVLDDSGVVSVDGLLDDTAELLKFSVGRHITRGLAPITALGVAVGAYSTVTEADESSVPG